MNRGQNPFGAPDVLAFGGGATETTMPPFALAIIVVVGICIVLVPRRHVIAPLLLGLLLIPTGNQIYFGGVHWLAPRLITAFGLVRILVMRVRSVRPVFSGGITFLDRAFFVYIGCQIAAVMLLNGLAPAAIINQCGVFVDFVVAYALMRALVRERTDAYYALRWLALSAAILAVEMVREQALLQNAFGLLGGTRLVPLLRDGRARAQGPFQHALTAGTFGAASLPLFAMLWRNGRSRITGAIGAVACTTITLCANSSTPLLAYGSGLLSLAVWPLRRRMRTVRWLMVTVVAALAVVMKAPVWFLIARIDLTGSSSGYQRAMLVDQFIRHFTDWWLIGTNQSAMWGYDLWDTQNQFVNVGQTGGLLALGGFAAMISHGFSLLGRGRKNHAGQEQETECWLLGASLLAYIVAFFGIAYFDQLKYGWLLLLSLIPALTNAPSSDRGAEVRAVRGVATPRLTRAAFERQPREKVRLRPYSRPFVGRRREVSGDIRESR